ncbi:TonB-dependent receptor [Chryseobacterium salviniae]|uniref:Carboxypeptidase regulatory-like domain-containing protein n=1 Tax=Chryseobacterium salviniae TaxID=3101750 RepID=A0ABU6HMC5_9FLAO|nr:carboxypeptidase regulatory-like domain-containing protein [Chryseobacterium sp. T9W2-O]MEC3874217.1 carboxypeptidase regulatory-like domain-containing protein [Chryseobacterium sp. T9W2-O]
MKRNLFSIAVFCLINSAYGQNVTTGSISGTVSNEKNENLSGAIISAIHQASGSKYLTTSGESGNFTLQNLRVGGPYIITIKKDNYKTDEITNVKVILGEDLLINSILFSKTASIEEVTVKGKRSKILTSSKNGSGIALGLNEISSMPTISRSINDFTRLTPQAGSVGMLGKGGKTNSITVDGAAFNNTFGLGMESANMPGGNTNSQPISLDAIEQISVDLSPYNVKQGGFTGGGINVVTRSGDNKFRGSVFTFFRNENLIGNKVRNLTVGRTDFTETTYGFRFGGPIVKNKLFFFTNFESVESTMPGASYVARRNDASGDNISNLLASDLDALSNFLINTYNYNPGQYENYGISNKSKKLLAKLDWNINDKNKFSLRYNQLNSSSDFGSTSTLNAVGFSNNGYQRFNEIYSITGELNSNISDKITNRAFISYTSMPDYRKYLGDIFPLVTINDKGKTYTFGTNNAARGNTIEQKILQIQNDFSYKLNKHLISAGLGIQNFDFSNTFTLNPQGTYIFNSLADFYNAAPQGSPTPVGISSGLGKPSAYSINYTLQPGNETTYIGSGMNQFSFYAQDEYALSKKFKLTFGQRIEMVSFKGNVAINQNVEHMKFQDANGAEMNYSTGNIPGARVLFSPRLGFNLDLSNNRSLQLRGGTGIFTGNSPFTYISAAFGTNGLNEGSIFATGPAAANYPFSTNPSAYIPSNPMVNTTYQLAFVSKKFKMPQVWRSTLGIDWKLPKNFVVSLEGIYSKDMNAPFYQNINLNSATTTILNGRERFTSNRINQNVTGAYLLTNIDMGYQYFITATLNKQFSSDFFINLSYTYGEAKDGFSFRSTSPAGAYNALPVVGNGNKPVLSHSEYELKNRLVLGGSYKLKYLGGKLGTTIGLFFEAAQQGRSSYVYGGTGDVNGDAVIGNDLIFVPGDLSQINLVASPNATVQQQWEALDKFISNSGYLKSRRGQFAERNGVLNPWYSQIDLRLSQDFTGFFFKNKAENTLQFTVDILNFTNLLNKNWGTYKVLSNPMPITAVSPTTFQVNPSLLSNSEFVPDTSLNSAINPAASSRYRIMLGLRYTFN